MAVACGWGDIYCKNGDYVIAELYQGVKQDWMEDDWNNGTGCRFYDQMLTQRAVIPRLLMHGVKAVGQCDIPLGGVFGQTKGGETGVVNVGRNGVFVVAPHSN